jgi:hypothetical protein
VSLGLSHGQVLPPVETITSMACTPTLRHCPAAVMPRLAQYNEAAIAGVVWHLALVLGDGNPQAGLKFLLRALHDYSYNDHAPESMREVRDALVNGGLEEDSAEKHSAFEAIFAEEKIGWGENVSVSFDDSRTDGTLADYKIHLVPKGPYGTCEVTAADDSQPPIQKLGPYAGFSGWVGAQGDLAYTWQSNCLVNGGNDQPSSKGPAMPTAQLWLAFPYLAGEKELDGDFTLTARYVCADATEGMSPSDPQYAEYKCTSDRTVDVSVITGVAKAVDVGGITLRRNVDVPVLTFDASGGCHFSIGVADCGV